MPPYQVVLIPVTAFRQNCTIVYERDSKRAIVIDPGGEPGRILQTIDRLDLKVELLLLTHGHLDHAGGARVLREELNRQRATGGNPPIELVGPDIRDAFLLEHIEETAAQFGLSGMHNVTPDHWLEEGATVGLGSIRFNVLHTPGHTPGHLSFIDETNRFAVVGDVLFRNGVGRTDMEYGSHETLIAGIKEKLLPLGDDITFTCGHGEGSTFGAERVGNPFLQG